MMRLLLALLIALLPMPAAAAAQPCHAPPAPAMAAMPAMAHGSHDPAPAQQPVPVAADQLCIGCVAPATTVPPLLAEPMAPAPLPALPFAAAGEIGSGIRPALPPPRSEA